MSEYTTLRCPPGCDQANHGSQIYRADDRGLIRVPAEIAHHLTGVGGFERVDDDPAVQTIERRGIVRLQAPENMPPGTAFVARDGTEITIDSDGVVEVAASLHWRTDPGIEGYEPPRQGRATGHIGELLRLGFQHISATAAPN